jgi:renal tumor antigen
MAECLFSCKLQTLGKLGEGSFADVFKVQFEGHAGVYAVKRLKKRFRTLDQVKRLPEVLYLQILKGHPNIVDLIDVHYDMSSGYVMLLFECLEKNLYELGAEKASIDERTSLLYVYQMLRALAFMHSKNLCHRDIKPENCMVNSATLQLKLIDIGSTRNFTDPGPFTEYVATRWYRAPECLLTAGCYGAAMDVWAVGCILFEMLSGRPLFPGRDEVDQVELIHKLVGTPDPAVIARFLVHPNGHMSYEFAHYPPSDLRAPLPGASEATIDLIKGLLIYDPDQRLTAAQALVHPALLQIHEMSRWWERTDKTVAFPLFAKDAIENYHRPPVGVAKAIVPHHPNKALVTTRLRAAQRIKEYRRAAKPKMYFSLHTQRLLPMIPAQPKTTCA